MQLDVRWDGSATPFEGNRAIPLTGIPETAQVVSARVAVTPVDPGTVTGDPDDAFVERIRFTGGGPLWGANRVRGSNFVEVDFRARRTLARVTVDDVVLAAGHGASLQIDPGGAYVEVNDVGAIRTPGDDLYELLADGEHVLPSFVVTRFKLTSPLAGVAPQIDEVAIRSVPENVSLRLGDQPTFHTFLGPLTEPATSADFATLLTEVLQTAPVADGYRVVSLVVHSDTVARLDVHVTLDLLVTHQPLQSGAGEATLTFDVNALPVEATSIQVDLPPDARAVAGRTAIRFRGSFDDTRVALGPTAPVRAVAAAAVVALPDAGPSPQAQAQPFTLPEARNITGIDLLLAATSQAAQVQVDIREDAGGKPGALSLLPRPLSVDLRPTPSSGPQWVTAPLPAELHLEPGRTLWLIVQRALGNAAWSVETAASAHTSLQFTDDGGLSWRHTSLAAASSVGGLFRLRHRPAAFTMPIHVFVGDEEDRREVSLKPFEPLGRVDFVLDTEEFAAAITHAVEAAAAGHCRLEEHLANGDVEEWLRAGDAPQPPRLVSWSTNFARAVALSPDALYFHTLETGESGPVVRTFDAMCGTAEAPLMLSPQDEDDAFGGSLAVSPAGDLLFASLGRTVWTVDLRARHEMGQWRESGPVVALAADATRLFVTHAETDGGAADVEALDMKAARDAAASGRRDAGRAFTTFESTPQSVAVSADGAHVVAVFARDTSPESGMLLAFDGSARLRTTITLPFRPSGVAVSSRAARVLVGDATGRVLRPVDLARRSIGSGIDPQLDPQHLALASLAGDRAVTFGLGTSEQALVSIVDFGTPVLRHWETTTGIVRPVCVGLPFHVAARLGDSANPAASPVSAFSQVVPVSGGCTYDFTFHGTASSAGAAGEVIWRGSGCTEQRTDTVPVDAPPASLSTAARVRALTLHRMRLVAPVEASSAEVRFRAGDGVLAIVDAISLRPPDGPVVNADLLEAEAQGLPRGWRLVPPGAMTFMYANGVVSNFGTEPVALVQEVAVVEGTAFSLEFAGRVTANGDLPTVALHWLDAAAPPVEFTLDAGSNVTRRGSGIVPENTSRAEVSLTLPGASEIAADVLALRTNVLVGVPISVVAEAPGTLTVSGIQVVTDTREPLPPVPQQPPCPPTSPSADCDDGAGEHRYCPVCQTRQPMHAESGSAPEARPGHVMRCASCATTQSAFLPRLAIAPRPSPASRRSSVDAHGNGLHPPVVSHRPSPLAAVRGISKAEIVSLTHAGIVKPEQVAALDVERLAALLPSRSVMRARLLQGLARKLIEGDED